MSEGSASVAFVGDLLSFANAQMTKVIGPRRGLRRGTPATAWYELGVRLEATDSQAAMVAYERALAGCPSLADAYNNLGRLHHDAGSLAVAESCYRLALCADERLALYWFNLGVVVEDQGRLAEAVAAYEQALALDEAAADAHYNLARLLEQLGRRRTDEGLLQQAVRHLLRYRALTRRGAVLR